MPNTAFVFLVSIRIENMEKRDIANLEGFVALINK